MQEITLFLALIIVGYITLRVLVSSRIKRIGTDIIDDIRDGYCNHCGAMHPEATKNTDQFWISFRCPECGFTLKAHARQYDLE